MKINYQDLLNFLSEKPSKKDLSQKLFQLGHEHEINGDIFDMELTPNRGDCLSLVGLARDLAVFFGKSNSIDLFSGDIKLLEIKFENLSPKDCPKISFLEVEIEDTKIEYKPSLFAPKLSAVFLCSSSSSLNLINFSFSSFSFLAFQKHFFSYRYHPFLVIL